MEKKNTGKPKATKAKTQEKKQKGRPSKYTAEIAEKICLRLAQGLTLRSICRDEAFPPESTVRQWAYDNVQGFYAQYARARDLGLDAMADEILEISDTPEPGQIVTQKESGTETKTGDMIEHRRLKVDTRKWYLSKLAPKRYDKPQSEMKDDLPDSGEDYAQTLKIDEDGPDKPHL